MLILIKSKCILFHFICVKTKNHLLIIQIISRLMTNNQTPGRFIKNPRYK